MCPDIRVETASSVVDPGAVIAISIPLVTVVTTEDHLAISPLAKVRYGWPACVLSFAEALEQQANG